MEQSSQDMPTIEGEIPIGENPHESHDRDHPLGDSTIDSMDGSTVDEETNDSQNDNNHFGGNLAGYVFYKKINTSRILSVGPRLEKLLKP